MNLFIIPVAIIIINIIYVKNYKIIRNIKYKLEIRKSGNIFKRDIEVKYSPAIVSYLYNQKIEPEKDIIVDIFNLYARKIIDIKTIEHEIYNLELNEEVFLQENEKGNLFENDKYIIDTIIKKNNEFEYNEWLKKVINVYRTKLNPKKKSSIHEYIGNLLGVSDKAFLISIIFIEIISILIACIVFKDILYSFMIGQMLSFSILISILVVHRITNRDENLDMHLNDKAKEELKKWICFENFIKENSLIKNKKFEEIILYEQYIPFAMVLNINKEYKKEMIRVLNNEEINLIFNSIYDYKEKNLFK